MDVSGYVPSILRTGPACPTCGTSMDPSKTYHPRLFQTVDSWTCPADECGQPDLIRDEDAR